MFRIRDSDKVVKYEMSCSEANGIHPLLRDFWFLKDLEDSGIVPKVFFVSPAVAIPLSHVTRKTHFALSRTRRLRCAERPDAAVRYLVMEYVGSVVTDVVRRNARSSTNPPLVSVLDLLRAVLGGLRIIHSRGMIHGDIHAGNIAIMNDGTVGFIDFGRGLFSDELPAETVRKRPRLSKLHCTMSPYALDGYSTSSRDDVFNAIWVAALVLHGPSLFAHCESLVSANDGESLSRLKNESLLFEFDGGYPHLAEYPGAAAHIENLLKLARTVPDLHRMPDYDAMLVDIDAIIATGAERLYPSSLVLVSSRFSTSQI